MAYATGKDLPPSGLKDRVRTEQKLRLVLLPQYRPRILPLSPEGDKSPLVA